MFSSLLLAFKWALPADIKLNNADSLNLSKRLECYSHENVSKLYILFSNAAKSSRNEIALEHYRKLHNEIFGPNHVRANTFNMSTQFFPFIDVTHNEALTLRAKL